MKNATLLFVTLLGFMLGFSPVKASAQTEVAIGFVVPLSGAETKEGMFQFNALKLAVSQVNASGLLPGKKLVIRAEDNQSTNPGSVGAFQKLVAERDIAAIFLPIKSPQVIAMLPAIQKSGIPCFTGATNPRVTENGNKLIFRGRPSDAISGAVIATFVKEELQGKKIAILHDSDAFGSGGANMVEKYARQLGVEVVKREAYKPDDTSYRPYFDSFLKAGAQAMVVYSNKWPVIGQIEIQYHEVKPPFAFFGNSTSTQKTTLGVSKEAAEGIYSVADVAPGESEANRKYIKDYEAEYKKEEPDLSQSWPFDMIGVLAQAIKKAGTDHEKLRVAIAETKDYPGMMGNITFDERGDGLHEASVVRIEKSKLKLVKIVKPN